MSEQPKCPYLTFLIFGTCTFFFRNTLRQNKAKGGTCFAEYAVKVLPSQCAETAYSLTETVYPLKFRKLQFGQNAVLSFFIRLTFVWSNLSKYVLICSSKANACDWYRGIWVTFCYKQFLQLLYYKLFSYNYEKNICEKNGKEIPIKKGFLRRLHLGWKKTCND